MIILLVIIIIVVCLALIALAFLGMSLSLLSVPFVPVSNEALDSIIQALKLNEKSILYDLGSGNGKVLFACFKSEPKADYVGIEYHFFPHLIAKRNMKKLTRWFESLNMVEVPKQHIQLIHGSFFNKDVSQATHVFVYSFSSMLDKLLPKLEKELKKGTRLVSCDFTFSKKQPIEVVEIPGANKRKRCKKLFVYEF
jgi:precorrin-6B methylase 2